MEMNKTGAHQYWDLVEHCCAKKQWRHNLDAFGIVDSLCKKFYRSSVDVKYDLQSVNSCDMFRHIDSAHLECIL